MSHKFVEKHNMSRTPKEARVFGRYDYYGNYKGYFVILVLYASTNYTLVKIHGDFSAPEVKERIEEAISRVESMPFIVEVKQDNSIKLVFEKRGSFAKAADIEAALDIIIEAAGDNASLCDNCSSDKNVKMAVIDESNYPLTLCSDCADSIRTQYNKEIESEKSAPNNYLKGILTGLFFSLGGVILWILIGMLNFIAGLAGFVIAMLMYVGYKKAGGKVNGVAIMLIIFFTLVMVAVSTYLSSCLAFYIAFSEDNFNIGFFYIMVHLPELLASYPELFNSLLGEYGLGILLTAVASMHLLKSVRLLNKKKKFYVVE